MGQQALGEIAVPVVVAEADAGARFASTVGHWQCAVRDSRRHALFVFLFRAVDQQAVSRMKRASASHRDRILNAVGELNDGATWCAGDSIRIGKVATCDADGAPAASSSFVVQYSIDSDVHLWTIAG